jgi:gamma-butyrobetaine dioxygenase
MVSMDARSLHGLDLLALFDRMAELPYGGEPVDQRAHALQCAAFAVEAGADDEVVLAAALHDVARVLVDRGAHEVTGGAWCDRWFTDRVGELVRLHVAAKRVLVATDAAYRETLTPVSQASLRVQGGPASVDEVEAFRAGPWADDALDIRRWDDRAKVPGGPEADPLVVVDVARRCRR